MMCKFKDINRGFEEDGYRRSVFEMMLYSKHNRLYIRIPAVFAATPACKT
jgi:hypothetical protein